MPRGAGHLVPLLAVLDTQRSLTSLLPPPAGMCFLGALQGAPLVGVGVLPVQAEFGPDGIKCTTRQGTPTHCSESPRNMRTLGLWRWRGGASTVESLLRRAGWGKQNQNGILLDFLLKNKSLVTGNQPWSVMWAAPPYTFQGASGGSTLPFPPFPTQIFCTPLQFLSILPLLWLPCGQVSDSSVAPPVLWYPHPYDSVAPTIPSAVQSDHTKCPGGCPVFCGRWRAEGVQQRAGAGSK